jgi:hypothetical protein
MRAPHWFCGSRRTAAGGALLVLASLAGCAYGPSDGQLNAAVRAATALRAQTRAQYLAVARAARQVRANGGFLDIGLGPAGGELYPCPSPITAPIRPEYVISLSLPGGTDPDDGQVTQLRAAISDLELDLRHEGFGPFSIDPNDSGYRLAWRGSGRVELSTFSYGPDYPPAGVHVLIVSGCARFDPAALPDLPASLR